MSNKKDSFPILETPLKEFLSNMDFYTSSEDSKNDVAGWHPPPVVKEIISYLSQNGYKHHRYVDLDYYGKPGAINVYDHNRGVKIEIKIEFDLLGEREIEILKTAGSWDPALQGSRYEKCYISQVTLYVKDQKQGCFSKKEVFYKFDDLYRKYEDYNNEEPYFSMIDLLKCVIVMANSVPERGILIQDAIASYIGKNIKTRLAENKINPQVYYKRSASEKDKAEVSIEIASIQVGEIDADLINLIMLLRDSNHSFVDDCYRGWITAYKNCLNNKNVASDVLGESSSGLKVVTLSDKRKAIHYNIPKILLEIKLDCIKFIVKTDSGKRSIDHAIDISDPSFDVDKILDTVVAAVKSYYTSIINQLPQSNEYIDKLRETLEAYKRASETFARSMEEYLPVTKDTKELLRRVENYDKPTADAKYLIDLIELGMGQVK